MVWRVEERWRKTGGHFAYGAFEYGVGGDRAGSQPAARYGAPGGDGGDHAIRCGLLRVATGKSRTGRRVLRYSAVPRPAAGEWLCVQRRCETGCQEDAGRLHSNLWLRPGERFEGSATGAARFGGDAEGGGESGGVAAGEGAGAAATVFAGRQRR